MTNDYDTVIYFIDNESINMKFEMAKGILTNCCRVIVIFAFLHLKYFSGSERNFNFKRIIWENTETWKTTYSQSIEMSQAIYRLKRRHYKMKFSSSLMTRRSILMAQMTCVIIGMIVEPIKKSTQNDLWVIFLWCVQALDSMERPMKNSKHSFSIF